MIFILALLFLSACDKDTENVNYEPQISPTQIVDSPTQIVDSPTQIEEIDKAINVGIITTPVLVKDLFMGGLSNGEWMQQDEFFNSGVVSLDGFEYDVYANDMKIGTAIGRQPTNWMSGEPIQGDKYEEGFSIVELYDENNQAINYDIAIQAEWNLFPRSYTEQNSEQENYVNLVKDYLLENGIESPETSIKQIVSVDLEGDGTEEMLIAADNTIDDQFEQVKKGDNAVLVFRKVVDGEVIDQIVEQDIRLEDDEYPSLYRVLLRVETIADLDGDSVMEVIVRSWYYEGEGWSIYKLIDNRLELVSSNGLGA
jgi:hypothetical protein